MGDGSVSLKLTPNAVGAAPKTVITSQPSMVLSCLNSTATFSVTAIGSGTLTYQWKKNGNNIGTNLSSISIPNIIAADSGLYSVAISGTCYALSDGAKLRISSPTAILTQPMDQLVDVGAKIYMSVKAKAGTDTLTYQWKKDGVVLSNTVNIDGANSANLILSTTSAQDEGTYAVTIKGNCDEVMSNSFKVSIKK